MSVNNIASERVRLGLSQVDLAKKLNVGVRTLRGWENNPMRIPASALLKMSDLFNCTTDWLIGLTEERK